MPPDRGAGCYEEEEPAASSGPAVQVSKDRVVAPPARYLSCSDDALLSFFQQGELLVGRKSLALGAAWPCAIGLAALTLDANCLLQTAASTPASTASTAPPLSRCMQASWPAATTRAARRPTSSPPCWACWRASSSTTFWPCGAAWRPTLPSFSAAGQGVQLGASTHLHRAPAASTHQRRAPGKRLLRLSSIEEHERRFLRDFMSAMHSSHYRLLSLLEWEAAQAEAFLFTLPVDVDWSALDKRMLQGFWGDRPEQRAALPDLSDRILIFCRGFEPAKMRGRYLMHKVELLLSFFLLAPLWACVARLLQLVGLKAPQAPLIARTPSKSDISFRTAGHAAAAAVRWRRAAKGEVAGEESLPPAHDASTIIERKTMSRHFPTGRSVLRRFLDVIELQEACIRDVVVLYRRKVPQGGAEGAGEKEVLREGADPAALARNIQIRQFTGIPLADLEMVMPEKKVFVPGSVFVQLVVAAIAAVIGLLATFWQASLDWKVWGSALMLLASRASQVYFQASSERNEIEREMNKLLFERTVASQEAVLHTLTDEMSKQHIRECFLCYCTLLMVGTDMRDDDLDVRCERLLRKHFGLRLDFTAEAAIPPLCQWGLVQRLPDGRLRAQPLPAALKALDSVWDGVFSFEAPPASPLGTAGSVPVSPGADSNGDGWISDWLRTRQLPGRSGSLRRRHSMGRRASFHRRGGSPGGQHYHRTASGASQPDQAPASEAAEGAAEGRGAVSPFAGGAVGGAEEEAEVEEEAEDVLASLADFELSAVGEEHEAEHSAVPGGSSSASASSSTGAVQPSTAESGLVAVEQELAAAEEEQRPEDAVQEEAPEPGHPGSDGSQGSALSAEAEQGEAAAAEPEGSKASSSSAGDSPAVSSKQLGAVCRIISSSSSDDSLGGSPTRLQAAWTAAGGASLLRSPGLGLGGSARISPRQLKHLESLRRQRAQQQAEALECLPSSLRVAEEVAERARQQERLHWEGGPAAVAGGEAEASEEAAGKEQGEARRDKPALAGSRRLPGGRHLGGGGKLGLARVRSPGRRSPSP